MPVHNEEGQGASPLFNDTLSSAHVIDAFNCSPDKGVTISLSKLGICEIGSREAEELATVGQEGHKESASLVERLTLGNNRLTSLPSKFELFTHLRYLNLKHNVISTFPSVLTQLPCLEILDISHNKLRSLPLYPGYLTQLHVLCLSKNKISRLPVYLVQFHRLIVLQVDRNPIEWPPQPVITQLGDPMGVDNAKEWVVKLQRWLEAEQVKDKEYDDSGYSERRDWEPEGSYESWKFPTSQKMSENRFLQHGRSFSIDSASSIPGSPFPNGTEYGNRAGGKLTGSGIFGDNSTPMTPPSQMSESSSVDTYYAPLRTTSKATQDDPDDPESMHLRTGSYTSASQTLTNVSVIPKHSLPDLRFFHKGEREKAPPLPYFAQSGRASDEPTSSHSTLQVQDAEPTSTTRSEYSRISDGRSHPFVAAERCSYFQRTLSTSFSHLPRPVACLIETARSILFSMGQLHRTIDHCTRHDASERVSQMFRKALDPANMTMLHLIRSLDRFDDVSQSLPSAAVCRGLVECCRDSVTAYRKALTLLSGQMAQGFPMDVRFTRWLLLELYGVTSEISVTWQAMSPEVEHLRPYIYNSPYSQLSINTETGTPVGHTQDLKSAVRLRSTDTVVTAAGRVGKTRRHAGSFSSKDVEIGKGLPSYDIIPSGGRASNHTLAPTIRIPKRQFTAPVSSAPLPSNQAFPFPPQAEYSHTRQYSQSSMYDSPSLLSPTASLGSPARSRPSISQDARQALRIAIEIAPVVCDHLEKILADNKMVDHEIRDTLDKARAVTTELGRNIGELYEDDPDRNRKYWRESTFSFFKIVLQLSNISKMLGKSRSNTSSLKSDMVKLVKATQEFASLSQTVSTSTTSRSSPPSAFPKISGYKTAVYPVPDNQLGSSLSRARSAQPSSTYTAQIVPSNYDNLQPVLPLSIKTPNTRRMRVTRQVSMDSADPG